MDDNERAKRVLRGAMAFRGVSQAQLADKLTLDGHRISEDALNKKISRGTFSAGFLIRCLRLLEVRRIDLD